MKRAKLIASLCVVASVAAGGGAMVAADTITFDELGPQPCSFSSTQPLSDEYAARGVIFSGPRQGEGGAILDACSNFGVNPRSGANFLAFNSGTYAKTPETIRFTQGAGHVELYASPGSQSGAVTLTAYDAGNNIIDLSTVTMQTGAYVLVEVNGDIDHVVVTTTSSWLLLEDMTWDASGAYRLNVSGQCPGTVEVRWSGATPGVQQGLVFGANQGQTTIPGGACQGTVLGLQGQVRLVNTFGTGNGSGAVSGRVGTGACGGFLQLVEAGSCNTSNVARIP